MLLYWGVLILAIALLVKWLFAGLSRVAPYLKTAPDALKERYARGDWQGGVRAEEEKP